MRVWLIEQSGNSVGESLEPQLAELARRSGTGLSLAGTSGFGREWQAAARGGSVDAFVCRLDRGSEEILLTRLVGVGLPVLLVAEPPLRQPDRLLSCLKAAAVVPSRSGPDGLWAGLCTLLAAFRREQALHAEVNRLQKRINDRLIIDKAKGVLMRRMGIDEDQAYKQLRLQSRRQRRPIRDIAQSLLDTHAMLQPNGSTKKGRSRTASEKEAAD